MLQRLGILLVGATLTASAGGCGATKVVVRERTQTQTVTRTVNQARTVTSAPQPTIYVVTGQIGQLAYKPDRLSYYGGEQFIDRIRWITYGGPSAFGKALYAYDTCVPSCAGGKYTYTPITIKVMDRELCHGAIAYLQWSLVGARLDPAAQYISADKPCP